MGPEMVLMLHPFFVYTLEQSFLAGRELRLEHPMIETRIEAYQGTSY